VCPPAKLGVVSPPGSSACSCSSSSGGWWCCSPRPTWPAASPTKRSGRRSSSSSPPTSLPGKSCSASWPPWWSSLLMFVLAGLPVVAFLQLFGGIDPDLLAHVHGGLRPSPSSGSSAVVDLLQHHPAEAAGRHRPGLPAAGGLPDRVAGRRRLPDRHGHAVRPPGRGRGRKTCSASPSTWSRSSKRRPGCPAWIAQGNPVFQIVMLIEPVTGRGGLTPTNMVTALGRYTLFWAVVGGLLDGVQRVEATAHRPRPTSWPRRRRRIDRQARRRPAVGHRPGAGGKRCSWRAGSRAGASAG